MIYKFMSINWNFMQVHMGYTSDDTLLMVANRTDTYPVGASKRVHDWLPQKRMGQDKYDKWGSTRLLKQQICHIQIHGGTEDILTISLTTTYTWRI